MVMVQASADRVKCTRSNYFMSLRSHAHGCELSLISKIRDGFCVNHWTQGRGRPCIQNSGLGNKFSAATLTYTLIGGLERIYRQLRNIGIMRFAAFFTIPHWERNTKIALARNTPIPLQIFHPNPISILHRCRIPVDFVSSLQ